MRYLVVGNHRVFGRDPGQTVELPKDEAAFYVTAGHLAPAAAAKAAPTEEEPSTGRGE
jgi:hypothetical protein